MENTTKIGISVEKRSDSIDRRVSVAPMMDWTDRHCRYFLRLFSPDVLLYTEMITAQAILRGNRAELLRFSPEEQPVAAQLGGSEPAALAVAAVAAEEAGYREVNLNCGCPSDRVSAGAFGACLMLQPERVAECVQAMRSAVRVPVTVKLRIGVVDRAQLPAGASVDLQMQQFDEADYARLENFARQVVAAGAQALIVHARKAVLGGLSPHENRSVPPLRFDIVARLRAALEGVPVVVNGGIRTCADGLAALAASDGIMIGREAYHRPWLLSELQESLALRTGWVRPRMADVLDRMRSYALAETARGVRLHAITRHMLGLMSGRPGAKDYRHLLSWEAQRGMAIEELFDRAGRLCVGSD